MERVLSDDQLQDFDTEYVDSFKWRAFASCVDADFGGREFSLLDVGGGNGLFADRVLAEYPRAAVTVLDNGRSLLDKNKTHPRKALIDGNALDLSAITERYDVVSMNWLLHHLVGDSYSQSIANIRTALMAARSLLTVRGRISIYDNLFDGLLIDKAPSWLIYQLTASRALTPLVRAGGANTAGVGVCFQSAAAWFEHFRSTGLTVRAFERYKAFRKPLWLKLGYGAALHLKPEGPAHFWLS